VNAAARAYDRALRDRPSRTREEPGPENELAWQARWFSGACGREFETADGRRVIVRDFGEWNREAGPDFARCTVEVEGAPRHGAIEVDLDAAGWEQHRHAQNPDYEQVVLHVVVRRPSRRHFARTASHREVPQVCLADHLASEAEWGSTAAARPGRCVAPLRELPAARMEELLAEAARRRMLRKGSTLAAMIAARGLDAALFEAVAITLGYRNNKLPFQLVAQRVPPSAASRAGGEALLFGVAGFLERPEPPDGEARSELTALWASWWKQRASRAATILPRTSWRLAGTRPANHPLRRLGALAAMARRWTEVRAAIESADEERLQRVLGSLEHPFWSFRTTWTAKRRASPLALLGPDRIREVFVNVAVPLAAAQGRPAAWEHLPGGPPNATLRVVSARLFAGPPPRALARRLEMQQGLLQIYADFCLRDHGECAGCRFPELVAELRR
jgi:hypothetical protein